MTLDPEQLERLVRAITKEVLGYLGASGNANLPGLELDDVICPGRDQQRVEKCARETRAVIDAGADRISCGPTSLPAEAGVAALIDHTLLKPDATRDDIEKLCEEAAKFGFASVCVNPWNVAQAAELLRGSCVRICTVVGFPLGATLPQVKIYEAEQAIKLGAQEIDMVENIGALKSGRDEVVEQDIRGVVEACHQRGAICKVILETTLLTNDEKIRASIAAKNAGADFVKTSTGFASGGATVEDVALMRAAVGAGMGIKASGGIRTFDDVKKMVSAGATRIGASASVKIIEQARGGDAPAAKGAEPAGAKPY